MAGAFWVKNIIDGYTKPSSMPLIKSQVIKTKCILICYFIFANL